MCLSSICSYQKIDIDCKTDEEGSSERDKITVRGQRIIFRGVFLVDFPRREREREIDTKNGHVAN